jgi:hypothetical protein
LSPFSFKIANLHNIGADFIHASRNFDKGLQKHFDFEKNFSEKGEELRAFDDITNLLRNLGL